jgi:hypothetical protein
MGWPSGTDTFVRQERAFPEAGAAFFLEAVVLTRDADDGGIVQQPVGYESPRVS